MKTLIITLAACLTLLNVSASEEVKWGADLPKAKAQAQKEDKLVLINFTGSDWCIWCKRMVADTLSKDEFKTYAQKNLVLVELDFPNGKPQSDALKEANRALQKEYKVNGFPTFVVLNKDGKELDRVVGYTQGGPEAFIAKLEAAKKK